MTVIQADVPSASKMSNGQEILLNAELKDRDQFVSCSVSCDDIGEGMRAP